MTRDDFPSEMFWLMYQQRHTLPIGIDIESQEEWDALPAEIRDAVVEDFDDNAIVIGHPGHYNWSMFCLLEWLYEQGIN